MNINFLRILTLFFLFNLISAEVTAQKGKRNKEKKAADSDQVSFSDLDNSAYYFIEGEKYFLLDDYAKAYVLFQKAAEFDNLNAAAFFKIAEILSQTGEQDKALINAKKALNLDPGNKYYYLLNAEILTKQSNFTAAAEVYEEMLAKVEGTEPYLFDLAAIYLYQKDLQKALETYDKAEEQFGLSPEIVFQKQKIHLKLNNLQQAIAESEKLIAAFPEEGGYVLQLVEMLISNNELALAEKHLENLIEKDSTNAHARLLLAETYRQNNREADSNENLVIAFSSPDIAIDPKLQMMSTYISQLPDKSKQDIAIQLAESILSAHPDEANAYAISGDLYFTLDEQQKAVNYYLKSLKLDDSNFHIWQNVLDIELKLNQIDSVVIHSDQALELFPNQSALYYFNGTAKLINDDHRGAVNSLEQGKKLSSGNNQLLSVFNGQLGDAYNSLKIYDKSDAAYEAALSIDPNNSHVLNNYAYFLSLRKENLQKAKKMSSQLVELHPDDPTFLDTHAWVLYTLGEYKLAKEFLEKAIKETESGTIIEHYGDVLFRLGEIENAVVQWKRAKGMDDTSDMIDKKIADRKLYE